MLYGNGQGELCKAAEAMFKSALEAVENTACGGNTGVFSYDENALEMKLMVWLGVDWKRVLKWATLVWMGVLAFDAVGVYKGKVDLRRWQG